MKYIAGCPLAFQYQNLALVIPGWIPYLRSSCSSTGIDHRLIDICITILYFRGATKAYDRVNYLSLFLSDLLAHGSFPAEHLLRMPTPFLLCTVTSILEGNNINLTYSVNYRGIALSSVYGTIFDLIIL